MLKHLACVAALGLLAPLSAQAQSIAFQKSVTQDDGTVVQKSQAVSASAPLPVTVTGQTGTSANQVQGTSASAAADDGSKPVKIGCLAAVNGFPETVALSQRVNTYCSSSGAIGIAAVSVSGGLGNLSVSGAAVGSATSQALSVEEAGRSFSNIATNATTTVKSGAGYLHTLCINTKGASANTATIYDNTAASGTKIGTLDTTAGVGCQTYDVRFATGLTIVTATGTAADITVSYR